MSTVDRVTQLIKDDIRDGVYTPGHRLPTRMKLMERYAIARGSIDRVMKRLQTDGIIESRQGSGTYLKPISENSQLNIQLFLIQNTHEVCLESGPYDQRWSKLLSEIPNSITYTLLSSENVEEHIANIKSSENPRIIWNRPPSSSSHFMEVFRAGNIRQLVINRSYPHFSYICTDSRSAIDQAIRDVVTTFPNPRFAILAPSINPNLPFLSERELFFYEITNEMGATTIASNRSASNSNHDIALCARQVLEARPSHLFIPDSSLTPYALTLAHQQNLRLGSDINIITFGWNSQQKTETGIYIIQQNWDAMFQQALEWACSLKAPFTQKKVLPQILQST